MTHPSAATDINQSEDPRLLPGIVVELDMQAGDDVETVFVRRPAGSRDALPSVAFQHRFGAELSVRVLKGVSRGLGQVATGAGSVAMGASATLVGGAAAAFGGLTRALGYVAAGGAAAIGLGGPVVIYLASVAEAHGGTLAADYPQIVEAGKVLVGATTGAALGKFVLMAAGDRSLRCADTLLRRPGPDEMTGPGEIAHGLRTIGRGLRTGAEAVAGALSGIGGAAEPNFGRG